MKKKAIFLLLISLSIYACSTGLNDVNYLSFADKTDIVITGQTIQGPDNTDDTLKFSHARNVLVENCLIYGGSEDCIDINRLCDSITIRNCELYPQGQQALTIKGGSVNITLENVIIHPGASEWDIELGMYAHTGHDITTGIRLINVTRSDGKPVSIAVWNAAVPYFENTKASVTVFSPLIWGVYFFGRDNGLW